MKIWRSALLAGSMAFAFVNPGLAQESKGGWLGAWGYPASPAPPGHLDPIVPPPPAIVNGKPYLGMPPDLVTSRVPAVPSYKTPDLANVTVRELVRVSAGARRVRVRISNEGGDARLAIGSVHIGAAAGDGAIVATDNHAVTFGGKTDVIAPVGAPLVSDPVDMPEGALQTLMVSIYFTGPLPKLGHSAWQYVSPGPDLGAAANPGTQLMRIPMFTTRVDIEPAQPGGAIVAFGDSITEGAQSTTNAFRSWPDRLAERLAAAHSPWTVVNAGIGGNRLLHNVTGPSALARMDRDVLSVPGVKAVILLEGINDIQRSFSDDPDLAGQTVTADDIIFADKQIIARAHAQGVRVIGATLTPWEGAGTYTPQREAIREAVNQWIRTTDQFDGTVDFEAAVRDAADPKAYRQGFTENDHLHPNDKGYAAMAAVIDLGLFAGH
jgi:lysophospholipase L1-like esterase